MLIYQTMLQQCRIGFVYQFTESDLCTMSCSFRIIYAMDKSEFYIHMIAYTHPPTYMYIYLYKKMRMNGKHLENLVELFGLEQCGWSCGWLQWFSLFIEFQSSPIRCSEESREVDSIRWPIHFVVG